MGLGRINGQEHYVKGKAIEGSRKNGRVSVPGDPDKSGQFIPFGRLKGFDRPSRCEDLLDILWRPRIVDHPEVKKIGLHILKSDLEMF